MRYIIILEDQHSRLNSFVVDDVDRVISLADSLPLTGPLPRRVRVLVRRSGILGWLGVCRQLYCKESTNWVK